MQINLIRTEEVARVVLEVEKTFEYFVNGKPREFKLRAAPEFWENKEVAADVVEAAIRRKIKAEI